MGEVEYVKYAMIIRYFLTHSRTHSLTHSYRLTLGIVNIATTVIVSNYVCSYWQPAYDEMRTTRRRRN